MKLIVSVLHFLINTNIFVASCVSALAMSSEYLLGHTNTQLGQFVFFATLFTYNFQRVVKINHDVKHKRTEWILNNILLIYSLMFIGISVSLYWFFHFDFRTQVLICIAGTISLFYPFGLRTIPYCKILIISFVWTTGSMLLLITEQSINIDNNVSLHILSRFLFVFAITIPFDIRDLPYDNIKLKTIPIVIGISKSKKIAILSLSILEAISVYQFSNNYLSHNLLIAISISYLLASGLILKSNEKSRDLYYSFWVESLSIIFYCFLAISILVF